MRDRGGANVESSRRMKNLLCCCVLLVAACGSSSPDQSSTDLAGADLAHVTPPGSDLATPPGSDLATLPGADLASSGLCCGQPGDTGNELGVGKYCGQITDCSGQANLCASLGDPKLHFCTMICQQGGNCGSGATCQCQGGQCGCFPNSCLNMPNDC